jgi:pyruvate dehydrogenase E2 component (dihydrolipoamide acetyltransferase)
LKTAAAQCAAQEFREVALTNIVDVKVPDIGDFKDVPIIEISVKPGEIVKLDDPLITLESDKASMEVPSPSAGTVKEIFVKIGDRVGKDFLFARLESGEEVSSAQAAPAVMQQQEQPVSPKGPASLAAAPKPVAGPAIQDFSGAHASPGVRRLARELDIDLAVIKGTGEKGRVTKEDLKASLGGGATASSAGAPSGGMGIPEIPAVDFSKFGPVEIKPMVRIKRISGPYLHRAWLNVPHVTHNDEADISEIEKYRKELDDAGKADKKKPYRVSLLPFLMKASVNALKAFPDFNTSLTPEKDALVYKKFYNIGIAVDTPEGLVVPVVKDVDRKGVIEISRELGDISAKARDGKLTPSEMQGATFTISSLGGIGGSAFTPIVNAPEVAILGVVRSKMAPVWNGEAFVPRLMLPLCLSYDHRVIDGAAAARFARHLANVLEDVRRLVL